MASFTLMLLAVSAHAAVQGSSDSQCLLQSATRVEDNKHVTPSNCALPPHGTWCTVSLGAANFQLAVYNSADIVSSSICSSGTWEMQPSDVTDLGAPGHALDIGANVGFYTFVLAAHGWTVTAFEPMSANNALLEASMCANPQLKDKITLNKFGLGAKDDHCIIYSGDDNLGDGVSKCGDAAKEPIPAGYHLREEMDVKPLDAVLTEEHVDKIDFVKMDVEGFECQVMAGGQSLLTKFRPRMIQSEVWPQMQGCLPHDYLESFAKASYSVTRDRHCTTPENLSSPQQIDNRFMCRKTEQTGLSLLRAVSSLGQKERRIVWLTPEQ